MPSLSERFDNLKHKTETCITLFPHIPNYYDIRSQILRDSDFQLMDRIEAEDNAIEADFVNNKDADERDEKLNRLSMFALSALIEDKLGDDTKWRQYLQIREAVNRGENPEPPTRPGRRN